MTAAVMAILAAILFIILGIVWIQSAQAQYDATLNPPPKVVNTVLPDEASLERGQAQFIAACARWANADDLKDLVTPRARDEALFAATRDGWRDLRACNPMTDTQRWDVVNYLRTLNRSA